MKGTNKNTKGGGILKRSILWKEKIHVNENQKRAEIALWTNGVSYFWNIVSKLCLTFWAKSDSRWTHRKSSIL